MVGEVVRGAAVVVVDGSYTTNYAENSFHAIGPRRVRYNGIQCKTLEPKWHGVRYYTSTETLSCSYDNNCHGCAEIQCANIQQREDYKSKATIPQGDVALQLVIDYKRLLSPDWKESCVNTARHPTAR